MPPLAFSIIGDHIETFHLLLECENLDKSIMGVTLLNMYKEHCSMVMYI